jgi:outer membrane protein OmpA-like peptidoglycan-associated protein
MTVRAAKHVFMVVFALMIATACSRSCPECNCPVCPQPQAVVVEQPQQVVVAGPCTEEWIHMPVIISFPTGGAEVDPANRAILAEVVSTARVRTDIRRVRVEGHTDTCGSENNNMSLSTGRAENVALALVELGVPRELIETVGFGSTQPRANEACGRAQQELSRQTNRRVEFSILVCRSATSGN